MPRHIARVASALVAAAGALTGCSGGSEPSPGTTPPAISPSATTLNFDAACTSEVLLPLLKSTFDDPSRDLIIDRVDIQRCRNGYAHAFAVPRQNPSASPQYESEQLFMRYVSGQWTTVAQGTGISCTDPDLESDLLTVCTALGYRS